VLTLLVGRGMSYERAASVLGVSADAVRDRAHVALALLAPAQARELSGEERGQVADYMLGQDSDSEMQDARELMESSPAASAWAHTLSGELESYSQPSTPASGAEPRAEREPRARSSRRGGVILLAAVAVAAIIAVVLILVLPGGGKSTSGGGSASASHNKPQIVGRAAMTSPNGAHSVGEVFILQEGSRRAYYIAAVGLPPTEGFFYALWLYNSPTDSRPLNRTPKVTSNGKLAGGALLPPGAEKYKEMLLTRETQVSPTPKKPGPVVLQGKLEFKS